MISGKWKVLGQVKMFKYLGQWITVDLGQWITMDLGQWITVDGRCDHANVRLRIK